MIKVWCPQCLKTGLQHTDDDGNERRGYKRWCPRCREWVPPIYKQMRPTQEEGELVKERWP